MPSFNVLIATTGRPTLTSMLASLLPQMRDCDCVTVFFDGATGGAVDRFKCLLNTFACEVDVVDQQPALGAWGHNARTMYAPKLRRRDFVLHADDDDYYVPGVFDTLRTLCVDPNVLYVTHFLDGNFIVPNLHDDSVRIGNISTQLGVIPWSVNASAPPWPPVYGGDGMFYEALHRSRVPFVRLRGVFTYMKNAALPPCAIATARPPRPPVNTRVPNPVAASSVATAKPTVLPMATSTGVNTGMVACVVAAFAAGVMIASALTVLYRYKKQQLRTPQFPSGK